MNLDQIEHVMRALHSVFKLDVAAQKDVVDIISFVEACVTSNLRQHVDERCAAYSRLQQIV